MQIISMQIILIHDDEKRYFESLVKLEEEGEIKIFPYHVHFIKTFLKGLLRKKVNLSILAFKTFIFFIRSFFIKDKIILIGIAPYDPAILLWQHLTKRNKVIYHTSWPYWDFEQGSIKPLIFKRLIFKNWKNFIESENTFIVAVLNPIKNEILRKFRKEEEKIFVIPHSVDLEIFKSTNKTKKEKVGVLFVGRLVYEKGLEDLKKIILHFKNSKEIFFGIVGDGKDKNIVKNTFELENVKYYGYLNDKKKLSEIMNEYDIFLLPSFKTEKWEELFGISIIEAMAKGLVPIVTDCIGPRHIVEDGINGFVVKQRDVEKMIEQLKSLKENEKLYFSLRINAIKDSEKYNLEKIQEEWKHLIFNKISARRKVK
ncbi:MAG: glycosyltransferase family 4 protein [Brevinematia bacterium]